MASITPGNTLLERREFPVVHWRVTPVSSTAHSEVILVHGLGEHSGRMMPLARQLASLGYNCRVPDLPGHGGCGGEFHHAVIEAYLKSANATEVIDRLQALPDNLKREADEDNHQQLRALYRISFDEIIETVEKLALWSCIDGNDSNRPHFIWGHSMGGLASLYAACRIDRDFTSAPAGLVLSSPAFAPPPQEDEPLLRLITAQLMILSSVALLRPLAALQRLGLRCLGLEEDARWASDHVSDLPSETLLHVIDPYHRHRIPLCFAARLLPAMASSRKYARGLRTPVFAFAPGHDSIVNTSGVRRIAASLPESHDPVRPHRLDIHEQMRVHDLGRSSCANAIVTRVHQWMRGDG